MVRKCGWRSELLSPSLMLPATPPSTAKHSDKKSSRWTFYDASQLTQFHPSPSLDVLRNVFRKSMKVDCSEFNLWVYFQVYPESSSQKTIFSSVVYCIHRKEGCQWSGELRKLKVKTHFLMFFVNILNSIFGRNLSFMVQWLARRTRNSKVGRSNLYTTKTFFSFKLSKFNIILLILKVLTHKTII